ncbi:hypothetical protein TWF281_011656 [Arthrobotrys megalospora]
MYKLPTAALFLPFLGFTVLPTLVSSFEVGFIGYEDETYPTPSVDDIAWDAAPSDSTACHNISPAWADNVEYAFVRTTPDGDAVPQFMGLYGDSDRQAGHRGCIYGNLKVIIKWQPEITDQIQMANTMNRNLTKWAVLTPHTSRTQRIEGLLRSLEDDYAEGRVVWRDSGSWEVDQEPNALFGIDQDPFDPPPLDRYEFPSSSDEDDYIPDNRNIDDQGDNYDSDNDNGNGNGNGNEGEGEGENGGVVPGLTRTSSSEGTSPVPGENPQSWIQHIRWPQFIVDRYPEYFQPRVAEPNALLGPGNHSPVEDVDTRGASETSVTEAEAVALQAMRELSDPSERDWSQGNPLDELE